MTGSAIFDRNSPSAHSNETGWIGEFLVGPEIEREFPRRIEMGKEDVDSSGKKMTRSQKARINQKLKKFTYVRNTDEKVPHGSVDLDEADVKRKSESSIFDCQTKRAKNDGMVTSSERDKRDPSETLEVFPTLEEATLFQVLKTLLEEPTSGALEEEDARIHKEMNIIDTTFTSECDVEETLLKEPTSDELEEEDARIHTEMNIIDTTSTSECDAEEILMEELMEESTSDALEEDARIHKELNIDSTFTSECDANVRFDLPGNKIPQYVSSNNECMSGSEKEHLTLPCDTSINSLRITPPVKKPDEFKHLMPSVKNKSTQESIPISPMPKNNGNMGCPPTTASDRESLLEGEVGHMTRRSQVCKSNVHDQNKIQDTGEIEGEISKDQGLERLSFTPLMVSFSDELEKLQGNKLCQLSPRWDGNHHLEADESGKESAKNIDKPPYNNSQAESVAVNGKPILYNVPATVLNSKKMSQHSPTLFEDSPSHGPDAVDEKGPLEASEKTVLRMTMQHSSTQTESIEPKSAIHPRSPVRLDLGFTAPPVPRMDWVQGAMQSRQRLQTVIQEISRLNALVLRARRTLWPQQTGHEKTKQEQLMQSVQHNSCLQQPTVNEQRALPSQLPWPPKS